MNDKEKMIKAARDIKTWCSSLQFEDCCIEKVECPFQKQPPLRGDEYGCLLNFNLSDKHPCDWEIPITLDEWISRFDNEDADKLSQSEQIEIKDMLIELKKRREKESNE